MVRCKLLNFPLDPGLFGVFHKDARTVQDRRGQFGLARTITTDGVDMNTSTHHVVGQDRRILLVSGAGGYNLSAQNCVLGGLAGNNLDPVARQVFGAFCRCCAINIIQAHFVDADNRLHRQGLEFGLRPVADHRHDMRAFGGQQPRHNGRSRRRAQRCQDRHLGQQHRIAIGHIRQQAEGRDSLQSIHRIGWVPVDIFEPVNFAIRRRHQFDHAIF